MISDSAKMARNPRPECLYIYSDVTGNHNYVIICGDIHSPTIQEIMILSLILTPTPGPIYPHPNAYNPYPNLKPNPYPPDSLIHKILKEFGILDGRRENSKGEIS